MLKIRLSRVGKKNDASFRIVVTEHYKPVKSGFIEHIGFYNPQNKKFEVNKEKLDLWMKKGAMPSVTVNNLLVREKIFAKDKLVKVTRIPKKKEEEKKEEKSAKDGSATGGKTEAKAETPEKKEEIKAENKEESVTVEPIPEKAEPEDKKPQQPKAEEKTEKKKPEVDKK